MKYRLLGSTGIVVSEIGFGGLGLSEGYFKDTTKGNSIKSVEEAICRGINLFDVSPLYKGSEELLKSVVKDDDNIVICTKGGFTEEGTTDFSVPYIKRSFESSKEKLENVDIYLLHSPSPQEITNDLVDYLEYLKEQKDIRAYGVSLKSPADGLEILSKFPFKIIEVNFNLLDHRLIHLGLLKYCELNNIGIIARTPLATGILTPVNNNLLIRNSEGLKVQYALKDKISKIINSRDIVQASLQFCITPKAISSCIPSMTTAEQVIENIKVSGLGPLPEFEQIIQEEI